MSGERDQLIASMIKTLKRCRAENNSNRPEEADKLMQEVVAAAEKCLALSGPQTSPRVDLQNNFLVLDSDVSDNESAGARTPSGSVTILGQVLKKLDAISDTARMEVLNNMSGSLVEILAKVDRIEKVMGVREN
eukprot:g19365.t1